MWARSPLHHIIAPPLSKAWLRDGPGAVSLPLKPAEFYAGHGIDLRSGVRAEKLARRTKTVALSMGEVLTYDFLIIATGARPIKLPVAGSDLAGVLELRTAADAERLRAGAADKCHSAIFVCRFPGSLIPIGSASR